MTVYLDLSKTFDTVPQEILVSNSDRCTTPWIRSLLVASLRVAVNSSMSKWRPSLGPELLNISAGDMNSRIEGNHMKSANNTKMCGVADVLEGRDAIWTSWRAGTVHYQLLQGQVQLLHMCQGNPKHKQRLSREWSEKKA